MTPAMEPTKNPTKKAEPRGVSRSALVAEVRRIMGRDATISRLVGQRSDNSLDPYVRGPQRFDQHVVAPADRGLTDSTPACQRPPGGSTVGEPAAAGIEPARRRGLHRRSGLAVQRESAERATRADRYAFERAETSARFRKSMTSGLDARTRPPVPELLGDAELLTLRIIFSVTGDDCVLDTLLFDFHRKTAARREAALNLRLADLDEQRGAVTVTAKSGHSYDLPFDVDGLRRLRSFAEARGAIEPSHRVFRSKSELPITPNRYAAIDRRVHHCSKSPERIRIGVHGIRRATLTEVEAVAGSRVMVAHAGYRGTSRGSAGAGDAPTFAELADAFESLFGPRFPE